MSVKTILKLAIMSLVFVTAQAYAESGGAPVRLAWKTLNGIAADARMLARCRRSSHHENALQFPGIGAIAVLLLTGLCAAPWATSD